MCLHPPLVDNLITNVGKGDFSQSVLSATNKDNWRDAVQINVINYSTLTPLQVNAFSAVESTRETRGLGVLHS